VGAPGERQFFLQVSSLNQRNTVAIEKEQLIALLDRFEEMIRELRRQKLANYEELHFPEARSEETLEYPIQEDFQAGVMGITWDPEKQKIYLEVQEISDQDEFRDLVPIDSEEIESEFPPEILQSVLSIAQVRGFISLSREVIDAGRQPCPFCGLPIDPSGHLCPRANGYKR
jgi:uncharacterized repeat protein (TIGR03847 family)